MKKILIAVDDTKSSKEIFSKCTHICKCLAPDTILLLYVEQFEGKSLLDDMMSAGELKTLMEYLEGSEYKEALDAKAQAIVGYYKQLLEEKSPVPIVETVIKAGHPSEQILETAQEENVDMIIVGSKGKRVSHLTIGSVSRAVTNGANVPVLVVK